MPDSILSIRFRLWLETPFGVAFGPGRAMLLSKIDQTGSLNQAASELGISYRAAWGKLKKSEEVLGFPLCNKTRGRRGYTLTADGKRMLDEFQRWQADVEEHVIRTARERLPWGILP